MDNQLVEVAPVGHIVPFAEMMAMAKAFAGAGELVPKAYQDRPEACFVAIHTATNLGVDPHWFMQRSYPVHGKIGMEGQLVIALINASGKFSPLKWEYDNEAKPTACTCSAKRKEDGEVCSVRIDWNLVKSEGWTTNPKWANMPGQMFAYRSATFFARRYCPEVLGGLQTVDEIIDVVGVDLEEKSSEKPAQALLGDKLKAKVDEVETVQVEGGDQDTDPKAIAALIEGSPYTWQQIAKFLGVRKKSEVYGCGQQAIIQIVDQMLAKEDQEEAEKDSPPPPKPDGEMFD